MKRTNNRSTKSDPPLPVATSPVTSSVRYVDVLKNTPRPIPPPRPSSPPEFSMIREDFPALPNARSTSRSSSCVPDDWTAMISDDDVDGVVGTSGEGPRDFSSGKSNHEDGNGVDSNELNENDDDAESCAYSNESGSIEIEGELDGPSESASALEELESEVTTNALEGANAANAGPQAAPNLLYPFPGAGATTLNNNNNNLGAGYTHTNFDDANPSTEVQNLTANMHLLSFGSQRAASAGSAYLGNLNRMENQLNSELSSGDAFRAGADFLPNVNNRTPSPPTGASTSQQSNNISGVSTIFCQSFLDDGVRARTVINPMATPTSTAGSAAAAGDAGSVLTTSAAGDSEPSQRGQRPTPPGFEGAQLQARLRTNGEGTPVGSVVFDLMPLNNQSSNAHDWNRNSRPIGDSLLNDQYGMAGLTNNLSSVQRNPHLIPETFGYDIGRLNVNLTNPGQNIYPTFRGALRGGQCSMSEVHYDVPHEYRMSSRLQLPQPKIEEMEVELVFYFFYTHTGDMLQLLAAAELAERGWRYHMYERVWLMPRAENQNYIFHGLMELGEYNYFNYVHWEILWRYFELHPNQMERTLSKAELATQYGYHPQMSFSSAFSGS